MANETRGVSTTGTCYARIMNAAGQWWNGSAFEAYAATSSDVRRIEQLEG